MRKLAKMKDQSVDWMNSDIYNHKIDSESLEVGACKDRFWAFYNQRFWRRSCDCNRYREITKGSRSHYSKIFRIICVAKSFDDSLQGESLEKTMERLTSETKIDLLVEEKVGYSVLWIS